MNKLITKISMVVLLSGVTLYSFAGPCKPIALSCMQNGYYKGGEKEGKGLIKDCVLPVVLGKKTLPNTNFSPEQLQHCKTKIGEKMKEKVHEKTHQE